MLLKFGIKQSVCNIDNHGKNFLAIRIKIHNPIIAKDETNNWILTCELSSGRQCEHILVFLLK